LARHAAGGIHSAAGERIATCMTAQLWQKQFLISHVLNLKILPLRSKKGMTLLEEDDYVLISGSFKYWRKQEDIY
jgi:hypothetical protein